MNTLIIVITVGSLGSIASGQFFPFLGQELTRCFGFTCPPIPPGTPPQCVNSGRVYAFLGWLCRGCDSVQEWCVRQADNSNIIERCPHTPCPSFATLPPSCIMTGPILRWNGKQCQGCDKADTTCPGLQICKNHLLDCFGVPKNTTRNCIDQDVITFDGNACLTCPSLKGHCNPNMEKLNLRRTMNNQIN